MRALVVHQPGGPEALRLQQLPASQPGPHQVVIAVEAVGVNPVDAGNRADRRPTDTTSSAADLGS